MPFVFVLIGQFNDNAAFLRSIFYDVIKGNNSVACQGGSPDCSNSTTSGYGILVDPKNTSSPAWTTTAGYDRATGLGSG